MQRFHPPSHRLLVTICSLLVLASCGSDGGANHQPDAGVPADGGADGGTTPDGGLPDGGLPDGGLPDGGLPDGGLPDGGLPDGGLPGFHPEGYWAPDVHGFDLRNGLLDCRLCHGADLTGGDPPALSCDTCHTPADPPAWRTDCVFCHGGVENQSGAPPKNLDGTLVSAGSAFPVHDAHVGTLLTEPLDCVECHVKAVDVLSVGHVFDDTPGLAEVDLGGGRSPQGSYDSATGCASLYCHGDGQGDNGSLGANEPPMTCESCHAGSGSASADLSEMTGLHGFHVASGAGCQDCHESTTSDGFTISTPSLHINGQRDLQFSAAGFTYDQGTQSCTGTCHGYPHAERPWIGTGERFHPSGFASPDVHSPEMELQRMDCRSCHGADLTGGSGPSCDSCHSAGWRSDCVFCHGAGDTLTGAPPRDLGSLDLSVSLSFRAHTAHVTQGISQAFDCLQCHIKPTNVLSVEHAFDDTPGSAEVGFAMGLSAAGVYDGAGSCSSLYCHGNGLGNNGTAVDGSTPMQCNSCHPDMTSGESAWGSMSGEHRKHLQENYTCGNCHLDVTDDGASIRGPLLHVDGAVQIRFTDTRITYNPNTDRCSGNCHGENHQSEDW